VEWLRNSDESRVVSYERADDRDALLVVINLSNRPILGKVDLKTAADYTTVKINGLEDSGGGPLPTFHLNGFEWRIYHRSVAPVAAN
jgi:hypothetical protein